MLVMIIFFFPRTTLGILNSMRSSSFDSEDDSSISEISSVPAHEAHEETVAIIGRDVVHGDYSAFHMYRCFNFYFYTNSSLIFLGTLLHLR